MTGQSTGEAFPTPNRRSTQAAGRHSLIARRLNAQLLSGEPAGDPVDVVKRLLAVQGQDPRGARLAIRARTSGLTASDVDRALSEDRSLLITWLNRGTLHLVHCEDYPWLHALTAPRLLSATARRLAQEGVSPDAAERGVGAIVDALAEEGPLTRAQLRERVAAARVPTEGQALVHVLILASLRGLTVRGPMIGSDQAYVLVSDWLGDPKPFGRDRALAELARRYLTGHGPADDRDLAKWSGLTLTDARAGLSAIASQLHIHPGGLLDIRRSERSYRLAPPRLLGAFDPLLLGWSSREAILGSHKNIVTVNGLFRPFALVHGRAAGIWSMPRGEVVLKPFDRLKGPDEVALRSEAHDVVRYLQVAGKPPGEARPRG